MGVQRSLLWLTLIVFAFAGRSGSAAITLELGSARLLPDTANQELTIGLSGGDVINGADVFLKITSPSGSQTPVFQIDSDPASGAITNGVRADEPGNIFANEVLFLDDAGSSGSNAFFAILANDNVGRPASGPLVTLIVDTTGIFDGDFMISDFGSPDAFETRFNDVNFVEIPLSASSGGTISIAAIPEPGSISLLGIGLVVSFVGVRRRRSQD